MNFDSSSARSPQTDGGMQYHIRCKPGDLAKYVLMPGDPERVPLIGKNWDEYKEVAFNREYRSAVGIYKGVNISACSTGIGGPSTEIAFVELSRVGCDTFIRVGSTGAIQPEIECGDMIINTGAVRLDGSSDLYVRKEYPAVASYEVTMALIEACENLEKRYFLGISACSASFYAGQSRLSLGDYWQSSFDTNFEDLVKMGVTNYEMETATLFVLASLSKFRAGSICGVIGNRITDEWSTEGFEEDVSRVACEAVGILSSWDKLKARTGKRYVFPGMFAGD
ncbi:MAG: nucleoside phosphorylase [Actinobacteria bacterium]|nr:nucleoside phosphorylase [Actinomycetota bacterium]